MAKLLLPILMVAVAVIWFKVQAQMSGRGLRNRSRVLQNDQLEMLFGKLAGAAGIDTVEVRVIDDPNINGLATDTGEIYVTRGLVDRFRSGEITAPELASVAAHEMGHLALGHMKRRMYEVAGRQAAVMVLARVIPFVGVYVAGWLLNLITARLSRRDEFEADAYATALMVRSGLGAEAQASMLEKLPALIGADAMAAEARSSGSLSNWLASHPPVAERAAAIRDNQLRWKSHAPASASE
ncbi:MAG: M48 family metallopeptidase [Pseudomonadota bacterium]